MPDISALDKRTFVCTKTKMDDEDSIFGLVELMETTVLQTVDTHEEKDKLLQQLKAQIKRLKALLQNREASSYLSEKGQIQEKTEDTDEKATIRMPSGKDEIQPHKSESSMKTKKPEEDDSNNWQMCACEETACTICSAEREASVAATDWFDNMTHYKQAPLSTSQETAPAVGESDTEFTDGSVEIQAKEDMKMQAVIIRYDPLYYETGYTGMDIIQCHPFLSLVGFQGPALNPCPSGIVTLQIAKKMIHAIPKGINVYHKTRQSSLSTETYQILSKCLRDGSDIYKANYGDRYKCLSLSDIALVNSHLNIQLRDEIKIESFVSEMLTSHIMSLEQNEILLFSRKEDYNVWSVIRQGDKDIFIFDCQSHRWARTEGEPPWICGAIIYYIVRDANAVLRTLNIMQVYSGKLRGPFDIGIVVNH